MTKEQSNALTAEKIEINYLLSVLNDICPDDLVGKNRIRIHIQNELKRHNAKLLGVLEKEVKKAFNSGWICRGQNIKGTPDFKNEVEYFETQVKPNHD